MEEYKSIHSTASQFNKVMLLQSFKSDVVDEIESIYKTLLQKENTDQHCMIKNQLSLMYVSQSMILTRLFSSLPNRRSNGEEHALILEKYHISPLVQCSVWEAKTTWASEKTQF